MKLSLSHNNHKERGSALIFILVGVMLFAALSYTVADMMRSGSPDKIGQEKSKLNAGLVLDFGRQTRRALQEVRISSGCSDSEISFSRASGDDYAHSPASRDECKVFHFSGGSIVYQSPQPDWLDSPSGATSIRGEWFFPEGTCATGIGNGGAGCDSDGQDNEDIIMILPYVTANLCREINNQLGYGETIPVETGHAWPNGDDPFVGDFGDDTELTQDAKQAGCFQGSGSNTPPSGTYHFFQILLPR